MCHDVGRLTYFGKEADPHASESSMASPAVPRPSSPAKRCPPISSPRSTSRGKSIRASYTTLSVSLMAGPPSTAPMPPQAVTKWNVASTATLARPAAIPRASCEVEAKANSCRLDIVDTGADLVLEMVPVRDQSTRKSFTSKMVGAIGFEPTTSWSQTRRSTKLSYTPILLRLPELCPDQPLLELCSPFPTQSANTLAGAADTVPATMRGSVGTASKSGGRSAE